MGKCLRQNEICRCHSYCSEKCLLRVGAAALLLRRIIKPCQTGERISFIKPTLTLVTGLDTGEIRNQVIGCVHLQNTLHTTFEKMSVKNLFLPFLKSPGRKLSRPNFKVASMFILLKRCLSASAHPVTPERAGLGIDTKAYAKAGLI